MSKKYGKRQKHGLYVYDHGDVEAYIRKEKKGWKVWIVQRERLMETFERHDGSTYELGVKWETTTPRGYRTWEWRYSFVRSLRIGTFKTLKEAKSQVQTELDGFMVEKTCAMTGKKFMESITTPYYCSPSSETYWCS